MTTKTLVAMALLLAGTSSAQAQHYKVYADRFVIDSVTNAVTVRGCSLGNALFALSPDGRGGYAQTGITFPLDLPVCDAAFFASFHLPTAGNLAMAPNGRELFLLDGPRNQLFYVDTRTNQYRSGTPTGLPSWLYYDANQGQHFIQSPNPVSMVISPDGTALFVGSTYDPDHRVVRITSSTMEPAMMVSNPFPVSSTAGALAVKWSSTPFDRRLYVATEHAVSVFNAVLMERIVDIPVSEFPTAIAVNPRAARAYVAHRYVPVVTVIDTTTNTVLTTIPLPSQGPHSGAGQLAYTAITVTPDGKTVFVGGPYAPLAKIDTATNSVVGTIDAGPSVGGLAIAPLTFATFAASVTLAGTTATLAGTFTLAAGANGIDLDLDDISLSIGRRSMWFGAGSFQEDPSQAGTFRYESPVETSTGLTYLRATVSLGSQPGEYRIHATTETMNPGTPDATDLSPDQVVLAIGDDAGSAAIDPSSPLQQTIDALMTELSTAQANVAALNTQNDALVQENAARIEENTALAEGNATLAGMNAQLAADNVQLTGDNAQLTSQSAILSAANTELTTQLTQANDALAAERATIAALNDRIAQLSATNETLRARIATLKEKIDALQARIETLQARIDTLQARIERLQNR